MLKAFIKCDPMEDPEVLKDLHDRLQKQGITPLHTERCWQDIHSHTPFLYFRNPYIRFDGEAGVLRFHYENSAIPKLKANNGEIISVNPTAEGGCDFLLNKGLYYHEPSHEPLPILVGIHSRPLYVQLMLNSLLYSLKSARQKVFIVASKPSPECREIIKHTLETAPVYIRAVESDNNLRYSFSNFGSKFFNLDKFIHYEEDAILPENIDHHIPFWTNQFNYRSKNSDLVSLKVSEINYASEFLRSELYNSKELLKIPDSDLWYYTKPTQEKITPIGGLGLVIDCEKMYRGFKRPDYCTHDHNIYFASKNVCIANIPVYHLGANQEMDYLSYMHTKRAPKTSLSRIQVGTDMLTGETKEIDLSLDWKEYNESISKN